MEYKAVIFDLDGVICFTDEYHYRAWKRMADEIGVPFDRVVNDRLRGVSRSESLEIILERSARRFSPEEKAELMQRKNGYYRRLLEQMSPADLPADVKQTLDTLKARGYLLAVGSSSKNARFILKQIGLEMFFSAVADGNCVSHSKPDPEVFLKAAQMLGVSPNECLVVEDAVAGAQAAHRGGMEVACVGDAAEKGAGDHNLDGIDKLPELLPDAQIRAFRRLAAQLEPTIFHRTCSASPSKPKLKNGERLVLDFGEHLVGYPKLYLKAYGARPDAPVWLRLRFAERQCELEEKIEQYHGFVSPAWVQEERVHIDVVPTVLSLQRRYAFRFVEIEVLALSAGAAIIVEKMECDAVTSADEGAKKPYNGAREYAQIDSVAEKTLRSCMQEVFEDGPKRDRRLWLGDLRIQALANYETYQNNDLVKRCLYLFAGYPLSDGRVASSVFITPHAENDGGYSLDYSLLFVPTLYDYFCATEDMETARDLWPTAYRQIVLAKDFFDTTGLILPREEMGWCFIDWSFTLDRQAAAQGVYLYCVEAARKLAKIVGNSQEEAALQKEYAQKKEAAMRLWDAEQELFVSGKGKQLSWASQIWMILGGVLETKTARRTLDKIALCKNAVTPVTPYLVHYYVQALLNVEEKEKAARVISAYWGGMIDRGADTFWEMYDPDHAALAPYGGTIVNSYCHAWSCGASYFLRKYGL